MVGSNDLAVQITSDDAASSKAFAISKGYWSDQYIRLFSFNVISKTPEINRGYYIRSQSFKAIVLSFLKVQVYIL